MSPASSRQIAVQGFPAARKPPESCPARRRKSWQLVDVGCFERGGERQAAAGEIDRWIHQYAKCRKRRNPRRVTRTRDLVDQHWRQIVALADELVRHQELDRAQIEPILNGRGPDSYHPWQAKAQPELENQVDGLMLALRSVGDQLETRYAQIIAAVVCNQRSLVKQRRGGDPGVGTLNPAITSAHLQQRSGLDGTTVNLWRNVRSN